VRNVDVAIIGAGSGGLSARREVAKKTDNYVVIDGGKLGTTCARVGCMPSKVLIQIAQDFERRKKLAEQGIMGAENLSIDTVQVMKHVRKLRDRFVSGVLGGGRSWMEQKLMPDYASFIDANTLQVGTEQVWAKKIIIATGSTPVIPKELNDYKSFILTTDDFFEIDDLPKSIAVIGTGVIGIELGQALHRLGVKTVGIGRSENISGVSDPKLKAYVLKKFTEDMTASFGGISSVEKIGNELKLKSRKNEYLVEKILITAGRKTNWDKLGLEKIGVEFDERGIPKFCAETFMLEQHSHILLAGDNTGFNQVLHEASDEGRIAGYNSVNEVKKFQRRTPLFITFSDPNIAFVGKMYKELLEEKAEFEVGEVSFEGQGRSIVKLKEVGMLRVYGAKESGVLLGAELMAPDGEHLAHLLSWAISQKLTVNEALSLPFYHPVLEEGLRTALRDLREKVQEVQPELEIYPMVEE
jgi:dihydrolipoamide dehydrogenase